MVGALLALTWAGATLPRARAFRFSYRAALKEVPPGAKQVAMWLPIPSNDLAQRIDSIRISAPVSLEITREPEYGNRALYLQMTPEEALQPVEMEFIVIRQERGVWPSPLTPEERRRLLSPDRLVPLEGPVRKLAVETAADKTSPMEIARAIYERVTSMLRYDKSGTGWGRGDAIFACDAKHGNCTDFHALIIGMARCLGIPARFSIGFPLPEQRGAGEIAGYHCWAELYVDGTWLPVDSSEAAKFPARRDYFFSHHDENRVQFSTGRDVRLSPPQKGEPLNYFVYPYVEVDGKPFPADQIERRFAWQDLLPAPP
ncbi:MAG: transglutaminase domain-containing protein [Armatimonadetes bacterium]|nr:transglutaminase domain-containing protein [Armatimonadota bacterium]